MVQADPFPNTPRDQIRRKEPLLGQASLEDDMERSEAEQFFSSYLSESGTQGSIRMVRITVKSGPGDKATIVISQIWATYDPESKNKTNHNFPTMCMLWQYVGIGFETNLSKHGRQTFADPESIIFMFQIFRKWIDHALSPGHLLSLSLIHI